MVDKTAFGNLSDIDKLNAMALLTQAAIEEQPQIIEITNETISFGGDNIILNPMETPEDLKPVDEETLLQDKLKFWIDKGSELKTQLEEAVQKVKFYEKAIKSYNKAFKK